MTEILTNKDNLQKYGFCVVRHLLDFKEIEQYRSAIQKLTKISKKRTTSDLYNFPETWNYIVNDRLLNILRNLLGSDIYFLHDLQAQQYNETNISPNASYNSSWHRDGPCRQTGKGPDWDDDVPYNVVTVITYLESNNATSSGVTVIPASHKKSYAYTLSNLLRVFHYKTKNIKLLRGIRKKIYKYISITCRTDPGDCAIFFTNLFHDPVLTTGLRRAIYARYGLAGKHSKNYVNYILKHRKAWEYKISEDNKDRVESYFNLLKSKNIYYPLPEKKEEIEGVSVPISDRY